MRAISECKMSLLLESSHSASCLWNCLQVVEFPDVEGPLEFQYDEEWLGVLQTTHHLMSLNRRQAPLPGKHPTPFFCVGQCISILAWSMQAFSRTWRSTAAQHAFPKVIFTNVCCYCIKGYCNLVVMPSLFVLL